MYKQTVFPKLSRIAAVLVILACIILPIAFYVLFSFFDVGISPQSAAATALLVCFIIGYFIFKSSFSSYSYVFENGTLTVSRYTGSGLLVEIRNDKNETKRKTYEKSFSEILKVEKGFSGHKLFPIGSKPYTIYTKEGKYSLAIDEKMKNYLTNSSISDAFIDNNFDQMLENLKTLIAIPSVKADPLPGMPFGKSCADALSNALTLCESFGMKTKNVDNYCGWAEIGEGEKLLGILCHLDVVPAGDGWESDPFNACIKNNELFGRGAIDDKGPCIAAIYGVAAAMEASEKLSCRVRLIFGCDEESGWGCMERYSKSEEAPDMAFTPDAEYPVIITEKGIAHFVFDTSLSEGEYQLYLSGGLRPNMVPAKACAKVIGNTDKLFDALNAYDVHSKGISFSVKGNTLEIESTGVSAHGSTPQEGVNAFFELFKFLDSLSLSGAQESFIKDMLKYFTDKCDGSGLDIKLSDDVSGALSMNLGMCFVGKNELFSEMNDDSVKVVIDVRYPVSYNIKEISARIQNALPDNWDCTLEHAQEPHHVDKNSPLVKTLMDVYIQYTGRNDEPIAIGGGTYARTLPNKAVAFGVQFPGKPDKAHQANESIDILDLKMSAKMFASAILKLSKI